MANLIKTIGEVITTTEQGRNVVLKAIFQELNTKANDINSDPNLKMHFDSFKIGGEYYSLFKRADDKKHEFEEDMTKLAGYLGIGAEVDKLKKLFKESKKVDGFGSVFVVLTSSATKGKMSNGNDKYTYSCQRFLKVINDKKTKTNSYVPFGKIYGENEEFVVEKTLPSNITTTREYNVGDVLAVEVVDYNGKPSYSLNKVKLMGNKEAIIADHTYELTTEDKLDSFFAAAIENPTSALGKLSKLGNVAVDAGIALVESYVTVSKPINSTVGDVKAPSESVNIDEVELDF